MKSNRGGAFGVSDNNTTLLRVLETLEI